MAALTAVTPAMALRIALYNAQPSPNIIALSDQEVMQRLAEKLLNGSLVLSSSRSGGWPSSAASSGSSSASAAATTAAATASTIASAPVVNLNSLPDPPAVVPLLPVLEEVQMEGATVLPEVDQTMEQIDAAMGSMDQANASLQPAPSKVQQINEALTNASGSVTQALDKL